MHDEDAPETVEEFGRWVQGAGEYIAAIGSAMQVPDVDWPSIRNSVEGRDLRGIAAALDGNHAPVADVLTCLALAKQPQREAQAHPLAEYVAGHPAPDSLALGAVMLLTRVPDLAKATEPELLAAIATLRSAER